MKKLMIGFVLAALCVGCGTTQARKVYGKGMYANSKTGLVGIGWISVITIKDGEESVSIGYEEDTAWLSPSTKTHKIDILLTGTNSSHQAAKIVEAICTGFVNVSVGKKADTAEISIK